MVVILHVRPRTLATFSVLYPGKQGAIEEQTSGYHYPSRSRHASSLCVSVSLQR
jgi:hypothetical protein